jgi:hypothetical protein
MNPWLMLGWVAAVCAAVMLIALTVVVGVAAIKSARGSSSSGVFRGSDRR